MTEEEAKTKWCPMVRFGDTGSVSNRRMNGGSGGAGEYSRCIASDCMMWKWKWYGMTDKDGHKPTDGHCGLAK